MGEGNHEGFQADWCRHLLSLAFTRGRTKGQAAAAVRELDQRSARGKAVAVSDLVVAEAYFALQHHYQVPKQEALDTLRDFLAAPEIAALGVAQNVLAEANLARANPGFVDRLIHAVYLASTTGMLSFEKAARRLPQTHLPK